MTKVQHKEWSLSSNDLRLYILKLEDPIEGAETLWADRSQLISLKELLNSIDLNEGL